MKILYFFELYVGNLLKYYNYLKKKELERIRQILKKQFKSQSVNIEFYCINQNNNFLERNIYRNSFKSILGEHLNIERELYKKYINDAFSEIKHHYEDLTKPKLPKINTLWNILEADIKRDLHYYLEKMIFIDSIIKRENPALIVISQNSPHIIKTLVTQIKYPKNKILFLRSKVNNLFLRINDFTLFFYELYFMLKRIIKFGRKDKKNNDSSLNDDPLIGICQPSSYLYTAIEPVYKELINQKANVKVFGSKAIIHPLTYNQLIKDLKYHCLVKTQTKSFLKKFWKSKQYFNKNFRYVAGKFKDSFLYILKNRLKLKLTKIIHAIENIENEIKSFNYKVIVILNEFGPVGKIICLVCQKYNIPVYFTPSVGIPNDGSEITPYLSDMINV